MKKRAINLYVDEDVYRWLRFNAKSREVKSSDLVVLAVRYLMRMFGNELTGPIERANRILAAGSCKVVTAGAGTEGVLGRRDLNA